MTILHLWVLLIQFSNGLRYVYVYFFKYPSLTLRVMVSATFCVIPSLTDLWAAFWSFSVLSMASFNSRLRYADLALASSASTKAWSASGVYGPRGSGWPVSMQGQQCMTCSPKEIASFRLKNVKVKRFLFILSKKSPKRWIYHATIYVYKLNINFIIRIELLKRAKFLLLNL